MSHPDEFVRTLQRKAAELRDWPRCRVPTILPAVRQIAREAATQNYRWSSLVIGDCQKHAVYHGDCPGVTRRVRDNRTKRRRVNARTLTDEETGPMIITKKTISRRTVLRGLGVTMALPLLDGMVPASDRVGEDRGEADQPFRRGVCAERHDHEGLAADDRRRRVRVHAHHGAAGAVPRPAARAEQSELRPDGRAARRDTRQGVHAIPDRRVAADERIPARRRDFDGPDPRAGNREAHAAGVARARDRVERHGRRLRHRFCVSLHQHHLVAQRQHAVADAKQSARRVRASVRRQRQHGSQRRGSPGFVGSAASSIR